MATNYVGTGAILNYTAGGTISSGDAIELGTSTEQMIGVALVDMVSGDVGAVAIEGVFSLPKVSAAVIVAGDAVFWDTSANEVDDDAATKATGDFTCGVAMESAGNGVTTVAVKLNGRTTPLT